MADTYPVATPEQPIYLLPLNKKRILIPAAFTILILSIIFYFGILLNISLLELSAQEETITNLISLILLILIIAIGIFNSYIQSNKPITFYKSYLKISKTNLTYNQINTIAKQQNFLDKIFHTYSLKINQKLSLDSIPEEIDLIVYLNQLKDYTLKKTNPPPLFNHLL
ncbi:hypothetical protein HYX11_02660 [Candidatus Woesearchaeota archaeon]|nr:hypothetical protein [Candidatus Woesearchaeota archaeon]